MPESAGAAVSGKMSLGCVIVVLICVAVLIGLLWQAMNTSLGPHNLAVCKNNLKQIGTAMQVWATDHRQAWPDVFVDESTHWNDVGNTRTDEWDSPADEGEPPDVPAGDNGQPVQSNTANFWVLIARAGMTPDVFLCPHADHLRDGTVIRFDAVRDFRGEAFCSYSYQNVLGPYKLTQTAANHPSALAVAADSGPMRRDVWAGAPDGVPIGATNRKLAERPQFEEDEDTDPWNRQVRFIRHPWELNSPNHGFAGMNVLYLDGHVEWRTHPYCGPRFDNIWLRRRTDVDVQIDPRDIETVRAYNDVTSYDGTSTLPPHSKDDSFLVP